MCSPTRRTNPVVLVVLAAAWRCLPAASLELAGRKSIEGRVALGTSEDVEASRVAEESAEDNASNNGTMNGTSNDTYVQESDPIARTLQSIEAAQATLLSRLDRLDGYVNSSLERVAEDLSMANETRAAVDNLTMDSDFARAQVQETLSLINNTNETLNDTQFMVTNLSAEEDRVNKTVLDANETLYEVQSLQDLGDQVKENTRLLNNVKPRLDAADTKLHAVEIRLQQGNISEVVGDIAKRSMTDVFRDMGRALRSTV